MTEFLRYELLIGFTLLMLSVTQNIQSLSEMVEQINVPTNMQSLITPITGLDYAIYENISTALQITTAPCVQTSSSKPYSLSQYPTHKNMGLCWVNRSRTIYHKPLPQYTDQVVRSHDNEDYWPSSIRNPNCENSTLIQPPASVQSYTLANIFTIPILTVKSGSIDSPTLKQSSTTPSPPTNTLTAVKHENGH